MNLFFSLYVTYFQLKQDQLAVKLKAEERKRSEEQQKKKEEDEAERERLRRDEDKRRVRNSVSSFSCIPGLFPNAMNRVITAALLETAVV